MLNYVPLLARILISAIFIISGFSKVMDPEATVGMINQAGLPGAVALTWIAAIIELVGGLMLLVGFMAREASLLMFLYLIPVTVIMHPPNQNMMQMINFLKNLSIMGGLLMVTAFGPGLASIDARSREVEDAPTVPLIPRMLGRRRLTR